MAPVAKFGIAVLVLVGAAFAYDLLTPPSELTARVRIDVIGMPAPKMIVVDRGTCDAVTVATDRSLSHARCGVPLGSRTFTVKCEIPDRPDATLTHWIPPGDSHYVQFDKACAASAAQVNEGNAASANSSGSQWPPAPR